MNQEVSSEGLNRLRWRCRRGMLELDLLLLRFVDEDYRASSEAERTQFEVLLGMPDGELWELLSGKTPADTPELAAMVARIRRC